MSLTETVVRDGHTSWLLWVHKMRHPKVFLTEDTSVMCLQINHHKSYTPFWISCCTHPKIYSILIERTMLFDTTCGVLKIEYGLSDRSFIQTQNYFYLAYICQALSLSLSLYIYIDIHTHRHRVYAWERHQKPCLHEMIQGEKRH